MSVQSGGTYYLLNKKANTTLDLSGGDNRSIIGYALHDGDNQKWKLSQNGTDNSWTLQNVATGKYLGVDGSASSYTNGTRVIGQDQATGWDIWPDENDESVHRLFIHGTKLNIDLANYGNSTPGTPVELWSKWNGTHQTWKFVPA